MERGLLWRRNCTCAGGRAAAPSVLVRFVLATVFVLVDVRFDEVRHFTGVDFSALAVADLGGGLNGQCF